MMECKNTLRVTAPEEKSMHKCLPKNYFTVLLCSFHVMRILLRRTLCTWIALKEKFLIFVRMHAIFTFPHCTSYLPVFANQGRGL